MTFVYFWLVCGITSVLLMVLFDWIVGKDTTVRTITHNLLPCMVFGPIALVVSVVCLVEDVLGKRKDKVIIKGRNK